MTLNAIFNIFKNFYKKNIANHTLCLHCQSPVSHGQQFCCQGCDSAYKICTDMMPYTDDTFSSPVSNKGNHNLWYMQLKINHTHCQGCIQSIKEILLKEKNIITVNVDISNNMLDIQWQGIQKQADYFIDMIIHLGYQLCVVTLPNPVKNSKNDIKSILYALLVTGFGSIMMFILLIASWSVGNHDAHNTNNNILYGLSILIALPVIVHSVKPFFISAWHSIQNKHLINIDLFICVTLIVSCLMNFNTLFASNQIYLMCVFMFIGSLLAMRYMDMIRNH